MVESLTAENMAGSIALINPNPKLPGKCVCVCVCVAKVAHLIPGIPLTPNPKPENAK